MTEQTYFTDNGHVLLSGITGSKEHHGGKTATANWWQHTLIEQGHFDYAVCFSPKGNNFKAVNVSSPHEAANAVQNGSRNLEWIVKGSPASFGDGTVSDAHVEAMSFADGLNGDVVAVHDDAQIYPDSNALAWACSMGGNPGSGGAVKSLVASQDPWDLPRKAVRANIDTLVWVGPVNKDAERYFEVMKMKEQVSAVKKAHKEPHMFSVVTGGDVDTFNPVPGEFA